MYDPKDEYLQQEIKSVVRKIEVIISESTNKQQTKEELIQKLQQVLPIEQTIDMF